MSITRRILESAQHGFAKLTSLVIVDDEPLSAVESAALTRELTARRAARAAAPAPDANPIAKLAGASEAARAARERDIQARTAKVTAAKQQRDQASKAAADEAFRRMKDAAARGEPSARPGGSGASNTDARRPPNRSGGKDAQLLEWYKLLDLQPGADLAQIKSAYRKLMRKYHPDMHAGNAQKQKAANELSMRITAAYNGLSSHVEKS